MVGWINQWMNEWMDGCMDGGLNLWLLLWLNGDSMSKQEEKISTSKITFL